MKLISLNIGRPKQLVYKGKNIKTGIGKSPASDAVFLSETGFTGDGQADLVNHGGKDKAVCVYPEKHYAYWEEKLNRPLDYGAFGENMTIKGLDEETVSIGDIFQAGEAVVQISQPRQPCFKLAAKHGEAKLPLFVQETGFTGFYFRVLKEGMVYPGDQITRIHTHPLAVTVGFVNKQMYTKQSQQEALENILAVEELAESWRMSFLKKLKGQGNEK